MGCLLRERAAVFDLDKGRRSLVGGGRLLLRTALDFLNGRHDLRGGGRQFLDRRRQLLGGRADLLGGRRWRRSPTKLLSKRRQRSRRSLTLIKRLDLLLNRRLRLARAS